MKFKFAHAIRAEYKQMLEEMFFFNKQQKQYHSQIINSVTKYGEPVIIESDGALTMQTGIKSSRSLFASHGPMLAGVAIYLKAEAILHVPHIVISEHFTQLHWDCMLLPQMIEYLKAEARACKAQNLEIWYAKNKSNLVISV